jgi:hypothetical protein
LSDVSSRHFPRITNEEETSEARSFISPVTCARQEFSVADESVTKSRRWQGVPMGVSGDDVDRPNGNDQRMTQSDTPSRPDPLRWLWYTFGGGLGARYREWVLHDVTSPSHWVRQVARVVVQTAATAALAIVVLGTGWITWVSLIGGLSLSLVYYAAFFAASAEHRLCQHGYPWGTAQRIMNEGDRRRTQRHTVHRQIRDDPGCWVRLDVARQAAADASIYPRLPATRPEGGAHGCRWRYLLAGSAGLEEGDHR